MKILMPVLAAAMLMLTACNQAAEAPAPAPPAADPATSAPASTVPAAAMPPPADAPKRASATGVVESVDIAAKSLVIKHGPVDSLGWPGMTMTFQAPDTDLTAIKAGDNISFEFTSTGMNGTIVSLSKQ